MQLSLELILGIIGTLTGTLGLVLQWRQWSIDQPVLKMEGKISIRRSIQIPADHLSLKISLKNHGRRQIKIVEVGFLVAQNEWQTQGNKSDFLQESRLKPGFLQPKQFALSEGDRQDFEIYPLELTYIKHARKKEKRELVFYAMDSLDREYRLSINIPREETISRLESS
ncbi:MAG: hypothetical protein WAW39_06375 [Prosthecobacter sp.]|uniref:hypothetical protein n=1 Tax=Prosthecobacter sp. TaxID=1965333 RepID=UPI003BB01649